MVGGQIYVQRYFSRSIFKNGPALTRTSGPSARHRGLLNDWQQFSDSNASLPYNMPFSMAQAARNTDRHAMAWGSSRLREQGITFVSAGNLRQEEIDAAAEETMEDKKEDVSLLPMESMPLPDRTKVIDRSGHNLYDELLPKGLPAKPVVQSPSPRRESISSQSSEEILFAGRRYLTPKSATKLTPATSKPATPAPGKQSERSALPSGTHLATPEITAQDSSSSGLERYNNILSSDQARGADHRGRARQRRKDSEEALVEDYIANMTFDDDTDYNVAENARSVKTGRRTEHFRFCDGATESKVNLKPQAPYQAAKKTTSIDQAIDWDSAGLEDFDDFSTTDEEVVEVSQVLRFRTRPSGPQYLVASLDKAVAEPRWVLHNQLTSASAVNGIRIFEEVQARKIQETTAGSEDSELDAEEDDLMDEIESEEEENDRILKHTSRMTDEQVARALAKQEELGLGGDELLLLDGHVDDYDEDMEKDYEFANGEAFIPFSSKKHLSHHTTSKRNRRQRDHFPSASTLADALDQDPYGAFDILDFDRPSLKSKKKGRKSDLPFELGVQDPELAERLRSTWEKDRNKKAARKLERQLERDEALLEASERNEPAAIRAEIRQFLVRDVDTLELAPMDSSQRAAMHRLAKSFKLTSRSQGKDGHGPGRYTVLTKGPHTPRFTLDTIWEVDALLESRKFFPKGVFGSFRPATIPKTRTPGSARARRGGGGTMSGATYINGDVVGASAPEIGVENKGRAMLERMGWEMGRGLGAIGNEGSADVIKHVVKTTKAGLG